jgi:hypothetical protein
MTTIFSFPTHTLKEKLPSLELNDYHLIFNLNGVLVAMSESQIRTHPVVLTPSLKEFLSICVKKIMMYIRSSIMKRNISRHFQIIIKKISVCFSSFRIMD